MSFENLFKEHFEVLKNEKKTTKNTERNLEKKAINPYIELENECKKYTKIIVKVFGKTLIELETEEEINTLKIEELTQKILHDYGYIELGRTPKWMLESNDDKTTGYLSATYSNFKCKG